MKLEVIGCLWALKWRRFHDVSPAELNQSKMTLAHTWQVLTVKHSLPSRTRKQSGSLEYQQLIASLRIASTDQHFLQRPAASFVDLSSVKCNACLCRNLIDKSHNNICSLNSARVDKLSLVLFTYSIKDLCDWNTQEHNQQNQC